METPSKTIAIRSGPLDKAVIADHFDEIADTAAKRYDDFIRNRGNNKKTRP